MPCHYWYSRADLLELEQEAESVRPREQETALQILGEIFYNNNQLAHALMGGMNFYWRGSGRTTHDVDVAVTAGQSLEATLNVLNEDDR
jgi:hypothetical protein